jgi:hypothetical protein
MGLLPFLYWLAITRSSYLDSEKFAWRTESLLYLLVVSAFFVGLVVFYDFTPGPTSTYRRVYEFPWFFAWQPLIYTGVTSAMLRLCVVVTAFVLKLSGNRHLL